MSSNNLKVIIKINYNDRKKAINLLKNNTFENFNKLINDTFFNDSNEKYVVKILDYIFFDELSFKKFYKNIIEKYENNPNDFSAKNAPIGVIEIVDEYPNIYSLLNNEELIEMIQLKEKEILELKYENNKLKNELENKSIENNNNDSNKENSKNELSKQIINENSDIGITFDLDSTKGDYDIIIDIQSIKNLPKTGWKIKYNKEKGKEIYNQKKDEKTIIAGVIGNGNKGKSYFLGKLSGYDIPKGYNIKTEGLSIRYGETKDHNIAILDSAGQETPLLKDTSKEENNGIKYYKNKVYESENNNDNFSNEIKETIMLSLLHNGSEENLEMKNNIVEDEDVEFEEYSRDKLLSEFFIQKFIIFKSDILILVVGNITLNEQKLLSRIEAEVDSMNPKKQIYVIHNLQTFTDDIDVENYIENTLKKLYKIEIEEIIDQNITNQNNNQDYFNKFFVEKDKKIMHLIFINDNCKRSSYYNVPTIKFIQKELEVIKTRQKFSIIEDCKKFLIQISEEIIEENLKYEDLEIKEGENEDQILLNKSKSITLKKFIVDEMGYTLNNDSSIPKYSYYITTNENDIEKNKYLYINIELPGGGTLCKHIDNVPGFYIFVFEGEKNGDKVIEQDKNNEKSKLFMKKNCRRNNKFKLEIKIPNTTIQLKMDNDEELVDLGELSNDGKGVYTFKYKVTIINKSMEKKEIIEL